VEANRHDEDPSFAALLRRYRIAAALSQEALAERAHMSARGISDLERGVRSKPYRGTIDQLASALELDASERSALEEAAARARDTALAPPETDMVRVEDAVLTAKLAIPPIRTPLVARPRLLEQLEAGLRGPLTLLAAPAGSGKTTLLSAWYAGPVGRSVPVAWVSLDARDNDLVRFRRYVLGALDAALVDVGPECRSLLDLAQPAPSEVVLTSFLNVISTMATDVVLILDDFHVIDNEAILQGTAFVLEHMPPQLHYVLSTRADPPLPLARLRAAGRVTELRAADLRFTHEEMAEFLTEGMGLPLTVDDVAALGDRTEGWIAGLQLAAIWLQGRPNRAASEAIASFAGSHRHVIDYLTDEVLDRQPESVQQFLLHTSILDRLSAPLCAFVMHAETTTQTVAASQELLEALDRNNLFLVALDAQREWYRYHHLFAEALRHRLRQALPARLEEAHLRASAWFAQRAIWPEAIEHACGAGDFERAAQLLEQAGGALLRQSANETLWRLLARLPDEVVARRPDLALTKAWFLLDRGQLEQGERWLQVAERALAGTTARASNVDRQGEIEAARAFAASLRGDTTAVVALAAEAFRDLDRDNLLIRGLAGLALGRAYLAQGELAHAAESYAETAAIVRRTGNAQAVMRAMFGQCQMERAQGQLSRAMATCRQAIDWSAERGHPYPGVGMMHLALADILRERNDLDAALRLAQEGAELCVQLDHELDALIFPRRVLALIEQAWGRLENALRLIHEAQTLITTAEPTHSLASWHLCEAHLRLLQGDLTAAIACTERAEQEQSRERETLSSLAFTRGHEQVSLVPIQVMIARARATPDAARLRQVVTLLDEQRADADRRGATWLRIKVRVLHALAREALGERASAQASLEEALLLGQPEGHVRVFADEGLALAALVQTLPADESLRAYIDTVHSALQPTHEN
jgi:LuxR family maltose regulon positive regulatory protein